MKLPTDIHPFCFIITRVFLNPASRSPRLVLQPTKSASKKVVQGLTRCRQVP